MDQILTYSSDLLLGLGAIGAAIYCMILARRLKKFNNLENGVGGAVAVLSAQVDDMTKTLETARKSAEVSSKTLTDLTKRAEESATKLELMMASLHDLPDEPAEKVLDKDWEETAIFKKEAPVFSSKRQLKEAV